MKRTKYATLSNEELIHEVLNKEDATNLEIELADRLGNLLNYVEELENNAGEFSVDFVYLQ